jgi:hypothetical protein
MGTGFATKIMLKQRIRAPFRFNRNGIGSRKIDVGHDFPPEMIMVQGVKLMSA